jgi:hypothetical protein
MPKRNQFGGSMPRNLPKLKGLAGTKASSKRPRDNPHEMLESPIYQALCKAIKRHDLVSARYEDERESREFCPIRIGLIDARYHVDVIQVSGPSKEGLTENENWRCLHIGSLQDLEVVTDSGCGEPENQNPSNTLETVVFPPEA